MLSKVGEQIVFALIRVLRSFGDQFEDLITFLDTVLDRSLLLLHVFDGFCDQYLSQRIDGQTHKTARGSP